MPDIYSIAIKYHLMYKPRKGGDEIKENDCKSRRRAG